MATRNQTSTLWTIPVSAALLALLSVPSAARAGADLRIEIGDNPDPAVVGQELTYDVVIANDGPDPAEGATFGAGLPAGVTFVSVTPSPPFGTCSFPGFVLCSFPSGLPAPYSTVIEIVVIPQEAGTIPFDGSISGPTPDPDGSNNFDIEVTTVQASGALPAELELTKTVAPAVVTVGGTLTYTLTVTNHGPGVAPNVVVLDGLAPGATVQSVTPEQGTCPVQGPDVVECHPGTLAAGASTTVTIAVTAGTAGRVENRARCASSAEDPGERPNEAAASAVVAPSDLVVLKSVELKTDADGSGSVTPGDELLYKVKIDADEAERDFATLRDVADENVDIVSVIRFHRDPNGGDEPSTSGRLLTSRLPRELTFLLGSIDHEEILVDYLAIVRSPLASLREEVQNQAILETEDGPTPSDDPATGAPFDATVVPLGELGDADDDGIGDGADNCPSAHNPGQEDDDGDGKGDVCDNCFAVPNPGQEDADGDGKGNACDRCPGEDDRKDRDEDGTPDACDKCPRDADDQTDSDGDGVGDACDECPGGSDQVDRDGDGFPDACDNCPDRFNLQEDDDGDGVGNACDPDSPVLDSDDDGFEDGSDNCPSLPNDQTDQDGDGVGDDCDPCPTSPDHSDRDGDGVPTDCDNCPGEWNATQRDEDGDGIGTVCDNCAGISNADQADKDEDGLGDDCDDLTVKARASRLREAGLVQYSYAMASLGPGIGLIFVTPPPFDIIVVPVVVGKTFLGALLIVLAELTNRDDPIVLPEVATAGGVGRALASRASTAPELTAVLGVLDRQPLGEAPPGTPLLLEGSGFAVGFNATRVTIDGEEVPSASPSRTELVTVVPLLAGLPRTVDIVVETEDGGASAPVAFTVQVAADPPDETGALLRRLIDVEVAFHEAVRTWDCALIALRKFVPEGRAEFTARCEDLRDTHVPAILGLFAALREALEFVPFASVQRAESLLVPFAISLDALELRTVDASDPDADGLPNLWDNCPVLANPDQADADADALGDPCELPPLDHFMVYQTKPTKGTDKFVKLGAVLLGDELGGGAFEVQKPKALLLPADKNAEGVHDAATHLLEYIVKPGKGSPKAEARSDVRVTNQCSDLLLEVGKPVGLLVPAAKGLQIPVPPPDPDVHVVDHFLCHRARAQRKLADGTKLPKLAKGIQVDVTDQFQSRRYDLKSITRLCNPVEKTGTPILLAGPDKGQPFALEPAAVRNPTPHLVCYQAKLATKRIEQAGCGPATPGDQGIEIEPAPAKHVPRAGVHATSQLGALRLDTKKEVELCIPSTVRLPAPAPSDL